MIGQSDYFSFGFTILNNETSDLKQVNLKIFVVSCSENEATSSLSALVEMPHQTRLVELLIASPEASHSTDNLLAFLLFAFAMIIRV